MTTDFLLPVQRKVPGRLVSKDENILELEIGKSPAERSVQELLDSGIVIIDKPKNPTSHQVSAWVRDMLGIDKAGHFGTLDPAVTGVLPVALGRAARLADVMLGAGKEYVGIFHLHRPVNEDRLRGIIRDFTGDIFQFPPLKSAVKRQLRVRTIYYFELLEVHGSDILVKVGCQGGTYIRTLAVDVGDALAVGGHMKELRRTRASVFHEDESCYLHDLKDAWVAFEDNGDEEPLRRLILPMEAALAGIPQVILKDTAVDAICHGADLAVNGLASMEENVKPGQRVALMTRKGTLVAIGKATLSTRAVMAARKGISVRTDRVLMDPDTYPPMWKKSEKSENR